ncbi:hypothetical protein COL940_004453 [Colletotrichum noveboracense]|nr:hypothetical protein CBS470a_010210 [Colletotrichum nupharicola]KAJ0283851.1 hypothetical protein COL940_004453 [Colletotrichum noveboracense]
MSSQPPSLRNLQASTVFLNSAVAGLNLGLSVFVIPRLLESPTPLMLRQWTNMYKRTSPFAFRQLPSKAKAFATAAALCVSIGPWTRFFLGNINKKLFQKAEETRDMGIMAVGLTQEEEEGAKYLVDQWGLYNLGRSVALGLGGVVGLYTVIS